MSVSLEVTKREVRPRSLRNKLRHEGKVPAIVNGYKVSTDCCQCSRIRKILRENGLNTVITISLEGKSQYTDQRVSIRYLHTQFNPR